LMGLLNGGVLGNLINDTQEKVNNGTLNVKSLLGTAKSLISSLENEEGTA
jgi:hypothetical protein